MTADTQTLQALFPYENEIPREYRPVPLRQTDYLADGELRDWDGPSQEVYSPVCLRTPSGLTRVGLGQYPMMSEEAVLSVLEAAVRAYLLADSPLALQAGRLLISRKAR